MYWCSYFAETTRTFAQCVGRWCQCTISSCTYAFFSFKRERKLYVLSEI